MLYHPKELFQAISLCNKGQIRKWECVISEQTGEKMSLDLKTFSFSELKSILYANNFEIFSTVGVHVLSMAIPVEWQYGRINIWGRLFKSLGKIDKLVNHVPPFNKLGYTILIGARSTK